MQHARLIVAGVLVSLIAGGALPAADKELLWQNWRGPHYNGTNPGASPPLEWSEEKNVVFKVPVPGRSLSSPVVDEKHVFLLTSVAEDASAYAESQAAAARKREAEEWPPSVDPVKQHFKLLAYSRTDGTLLWERTATSLVPHESHYIDSSWASASPVTDGKRVIAHFGSNGTYAYDMQGELLWKRDLGDQTTRNGFGEGSSPALDGDVLVINWDHEADSFIVALNANSGETLWKSDRPGEVTSWGTPLIVEHGGKKQVVITGTGKSRGYELATGKELWSLSGMTVNAIPTPLHRNGVVYLTSGYRGTMMQAVALKRASGDLEQSDAVAWRYERDTPYVPTPLLYDDTLYFIKHFRNVLTVLDADNGKPYYGQTRLPGISNVWASPVGASGRVYIFDRQGQAVVLDHGGEFKLLAQNELDEGADASPALVGDAIYLRTKRHLYCLAAR